MANGKAYGRNKKIIEDSYGVSGEIPPLVPPIDLPIGPTPPVVPNPEYTPPTQQPDIPGTYIPPQNPINTQNVIIPQSPNVGPQYFLRQYIVYRGNVFINGQPAPVGTIISTNSGGSGSVASQGLYQIEALDMPNVEFYVNGFMASPQYLYGTLNLKQVDLYAVSGGHSMPRGQKYNRTKKPRNTVGFSVKVPSSRWFKI